MTPSTIALARRLKGAISFPNTIQGNRQRGSWERLVHYIESSDSFSNFDKATAYAEGYAQALADRELIDIFTERDVLIIKTVDEWRQRFLSTIFAHA